MTTTKKPFKLKPVRVSEKAIQNGIIAMLRMSGFVVLPLGMSKKPSTCPKCKTTFWGQQATQNPAGTPDLILTHDDWPSNCWMAIELKGAGTVIRPEQEELYRRNLTRVLRSDRDVAEYVIAYERQMEIEPNKRLWAWLEQSQPAVKPSA